MNAVRNTLSRRAPALLKQTQKTQVRALGHAVTGPPLQDIQGNWNLAKNFFNVSALGYDEYKQQLVSMRLFLFPAVIAAMMFDLIWDPPKSAYWRAFGPIGWGKMIFGSIFSGPKGEIFLQKKPVHGENEDLWPIYTHLVANRRLPLAMDPEPED